MGELFIKTIRLFSGERLPLLFDRDRGLPLFDPAIYVLTQVRARNRSSATIESALRAILVFHLVLDICDIDIEARLQDGKLFTVGEIDELARLSRLHVDKLRSLAKDKSFRPRLKISSLESYRLRSGKASIEVSPKVAAGRIRGIRDYVHWVVSVRLGKLDSHGETYRSLLAAGKQSISGLEKRVEGIDDSRTALYLREGLEPEVIADLLRVIAPGVSDNPWRNSTVQRRNFLIVHWLYILGLRRGELLNLKIPDIDFRKQEVVIVRRADDPEDPRLNQPKAKTRDRILPLGKELCRLTYEYVMTVRRAAAGAKKHDFLFVAEKTGEPLSLSALNKSFQVLRARCPCLPAALSPHVLRHSWNDNFSEAMDRAGVDPADEHKMRSFLMGWSETSGTAATYIRRYTRKRANQASLAMQTNFVRGKLDE